MSFLSWIRKNKLSTLLIVLLILFLLKQGHLPSPSPLTPSYDPSYAEKDAIPQSAGIAVNQRRMGAVMPPSDTYTPAPEVTNRLVIQDSNLSLLVSNVREGINQILDYTTQAGGYMVTSSLSSPGEAPSGTVVIRVPARTLSQTLEYFRGMSIKVVSENLTGQDVTDQYVDNDARLNTLLATKAKFQDIFNRATEISDIVNIQQQLINLQSQIDAVKGQQQYLEKNAQMAKVTIYLSTDELALPYAPQDTWRASVVFKYAVRSLVEHIRSIASFFIWAFVYSVFWAPVLLLLWYIKKRMR